MGSLTVVAVTVFGFRSVGVIGEFWLLAFAEPGGDECLGSPFGTAGDFRLRMIAELVTVACSAQSFSAMRYGNELRN
jgi:hypothetical protein